MIDSFIFYIQRIAIARALLKNAPILILDEVSFSSQAWFPLSLIEHVKLQMFKGLVICFHEGFLDCSARSLDLFFWSVIRCLQSRTDCARVWTCQAPIGACGA